MPGAVPPQQTTAWRAVVRVLRSSAARVHGLLETPLNDISSAVFPAPCRICSGPLLHLSPAPVCMVCLDAIAPQTSSLCRVCGGTLDPEDWHLEDRSTCRSCQAEPMPFKRAVAWSAYENQARVALHILKFDGVSSVAAPLGRKLAQAIAVIAPSAPREMLVIAVPMHAKRQRERGYNHSILLARSAMKALQHSLPDWKLTPAHSLLKRNRVTQLLFPLTAERRREMLAGAFRCTDAAAIAGKHILLIDDIMTTGATARECAKTLMDAGAASVQVATLARAQLNTTAVWDQNESEIDRKQQSSTQIH